MKFKANSRRRALEYEKDLVQYWKTNKTFEKSVENRLADNAYVFYDGPPFISGVPHHGTLLSSIVKDAVPRYQTMKGRRVERVWGWDAHGLPAERYTEKKLGINSRQEVIEYGIEKYILATRDNMLETSGAWEDTVDRIGRWVDFKGAYKTMDKDYMESIWWAFKTLYEKGKIYEGEKVLMYCTLDATPLSKAEVTMDAGAYQDVTDPSVYVKFKLNDGRYVLAWTTTPWTLPANTALAVNPDVDYIDLESSDGERYIVAFDLSEAVISISEDENLRVVGDKFKGKELVGLSYEPLITIPDGIIVYTSIGKKDTKVGDELQQNAALVSDMYTIHAADYVETQAGTGIVHIAPTYGEEDYELAKRNNIPGIHVVDENGFYYEPKAEKLYALMPWRDANAPLNVWESNKDLAKALKKDGSVWKITYITHSYPHCHRCGTKLMYRAHPSWFMDIEGQREKMLEQNGDINWFPEHVKHGRFEKTVEQAPDWNISRDRFWATAMPVWKGTDSEGNEYVKVVGSYAELKELSGVELEDYHRPWIDDVTFEIDGVKYTRIDKVMDSWFEAGSMPFAQFHYPFENKEKFEANFPGDFIVEYIGQVRAWFYYMHAMSVALFGENSFKNVIVTGNISGSDGRKMSKSYGNYTDPNELMDRFSADSLRFLLLQSPLLNGEDFTLLDKDVGDVARKLTMIWNMYDFFTMYAEVDDWGFDSDKPLTLVTSDVANPLDKWIISRLHQLNHEVSEHMDAYNIPNALSPILPFIEDASNWYVRRSRRRFWKSGDDSDKADAYRTLHYVLLKLSVILAPFTPFLAEELYQKLGGGNESVHLLDWPTNYEVDELVMNDMELVREYVNQGLSIRAKARVKVRQPLATLTIPKLGEFVDFESILTEELNVKKVNVGEEFALDLELTPELKREGLMREVIRTVQNARKLAELNVDDRIKLSLVTDEGDLKRAIEEHREEIMRETLALEMSDKEYSHVAESKIEGENLKLSLEKAKN